MHLHAVAAQPGLAKRAMRPAHLLIALGLLAQAGLAREVEGVFRRYLEVERVRLLTGEDERGRRWLRVAAVLKPNGS